MSFFSEASLAMIPSGYKTSKVYSALPITGDGDLTFSRSNDTATRVGPNGYIEKVRTNLLTYSNTFSDAAWNKNNLTLTSGQTDPNGGTTAFLLTSTVTSGAYMDQNISGSLCFSIFAKAGTRSTFSIIPTGYNNGAFFDLSSVTATSAGVGSLAKIESVGGGWFRCSVAVSSSSSYIVSLSDISGPACLIGDSVNFAFAQAETGDIATDYIATTSAAVTVGPVANVPRLDYLDSSSPRLLLEPQRTNLALYSEQFDNAWWTAAGASITANTAVSPDGTTSMDRLTETATTNPHQVISTAVTIFGGVARVFSAFVKKGNVRYIQLANVAFGDSSASSIFDLDTKTVTDSRASSGAGPTFSFVSASVEDYGNGILRLILVNTSSFDSPTYRIAHSNQATFTGATLVDGMVSYAGDASSFTDIWGAQVEAGAYATSYIPTLGASVTRGADAASKTGISSLIGQTEGTIFAEINFDLGVTAQGDSRIQLSDGTASNWIFIGLPDGASGNLIRMYVNTPSSAMTAYSTNPVVNGVNKIAFGYKSGSFVLYVNGVQAATSSTTLTMAACSRIDLQGSVPAESAQERTNYKQLLLFTSRLSNDDLASLTTI
jgi:hypothetical protein